MSSDYTNILKAMQKHSLAVKQAIQLGTSANANLLQGQTLAQVLAAAQAASVAYTDQEVLDLVEGNALIEAVDAAVAGLGAPVGGEFNTAIIEKSLPVDGNDINVSLANHFTKTITANTTFTVSGIPASGRVAAFVLHLTNGGSKTIQWWANVKWAEGAAPVLTAAGRDVIAFTTLDGGITWDGYLLGKDMKAAA